MKTVFIGIGIILSLLAFSCGAKQTQQIREDMNFLAESESAAPGDVMVSSPLGDFDADSAYQYIAKQVNFGPRVPNTEAHKLTGDWLVAELKSRGAKVIEQKAPLTTFDGTVINARNIFAQFSADSSSKNNARVLLLAHWDSRPWADQDPDPEKRKHPVDGANDGASGVGVLLEIARQIALNPIKKNVDILFVDAEDWGSEGDDDSWALGTQYFVKNLPIKGYSPDAAILLDMVGGKGATFCREYFSEKSNPALADHIWNIAHSLGYGKTFINQMGSAVTDDHVELIKAGIPAIDIIDFRIDGHSGFNPTWHTSADNLDNISKESLQAVGSTLLYFLRQ